MNPLKLTSEENSKQTCLQQKPYRGMNRIHSVPAQNKKSDSVQKGGTVPWQFYEHRAGKEMNIKEI